MALIGELITGVAASQGLRLVAGSNITPEVTVYNAADIQPSFLDRLGIRTYARLEDKNGSVIARYGETEPFNVFLATAYAAVLAVALFAIVKGFKR